MRQLRGQIGLSTGCASIGLLVTRRLRVVKASCCLFVHIHVVSFRVSLLSGWATEANPLMKGR
jgi:hypothetical protein